MRKIILAILAIGGMTMGWSQTNGNAIFDESFVHEIRITFEQEAYWDSLLFYYTYAEDKTYLMASIEIDGNTIDSIGVRKKGLSSALVFDSKIPFKVDFNEYVSGKKYDGIKQLNLHNGWHDPTMMREAVSYKFMREAGIASPRTSYTKLYINDIYWGLYILVEQVDSRFLKNWFENNDGNLFKTRGNSNLEYLGDDPAEYEFQFTLKSNEELNDWSQFFDLLESISNEDEFDESISTYLNMDGYTRVLAADILMQNFDSYYQAGRNFYLYYDSTQSNFQWIPWDYNLSLSNWVTETIIEYDFYDKLLARNVMYSDEYRPMYFNHLCVMIDNYFNLDHLEDYIDNTTALIEDALEEDTSKLFSMEAFYTNIDGDYAPEETWGFPPILPGLKPFILSRGEAVRDDLEAYSHNCTALSITKEAPKAFSVYPNPSHSGLFSFILNESILSIEVYSSVGEMVMITSVKNQNQVNLDLTYQPNGMYFVQLIGEKETFQTQIVKSE